MSISKASTILFSVFVAAFILMVAAIATGASVFAVSALSVVASLSLFACLFADAVIENKNYDVDPVVNYYTINQRNAIA